MAQLQAGGRHMARHSFISGPWNHYDNNNNILLRTHGPYCGDLCVVASRDFSIVKSWLLPRQLGAVGVCISLRSSNAPFSVITRPARGLVVSAPASVLVGREFVSRPGLTKTLWIGTAAFLQGARYAEELQGTHSEHKIDRRQMKQKLYKLSRGATRP